MTLTNSAILDSDFRYIDKNGTLLKSRTELSIAQMLSFLGLSYQYEHKITLSNGKTISVDFKTSDGKLIEVIDSDSDILKYKELKSDNQPIMAIGHPQFAAKLK